MIKVSLGSRYEIDDSILSASEEERAWMDIPFRMKNLRILLGITFFLFMVFFFRIVHLGIVKGEYYTEISRENALRIIPIEAPRGKIFDRKGQQLVYNIPSVSLVLRFTEDVISRDIEGYFKLKEIFNISREDIEKAFEYGGKMVFSEVLLKKDLTRDEILRFSERENEFPGVVLKKSVSRQYEDSVIFSHILGYESALTTKDIQTYPNYLLTDSVGRSGIEKEYESLLRGTHGAYKVEVDAFGRVRKEISTQDPKSGNDVILSLDGGLQKILFDTMREEMEKNKLSRGSAVAMDPRNGEILALVSFPSYDNNIFSQNRNKELYQEIFQNKDKPLFNRVVSGEYPPASTIKPVLAAAALNEGTINESTRVESTGGISVGGSFFGDWKAHGFTDVRQAIAVSGDVFFYSVGGGYGNVKGLGMEKMKEYEKRFGYGEVTQIDLPSESGGLIPDAQWKEENIHEKWYIGNTYHSSIGQGYLRATPLQVAISISAIANGGTKFIPTVASYMRSPEGDIIKRISKEGTSVGIDDKILRIVREGMRMTVTEGTAMSLKDLPFTVAGKTGTAEYGNKEKTHGWFASFAPYENPEIVLIVLLEEQEKDGYHAVPIAKKVYEWYFSSHE
ncbi:MAG: penicillin-binding protein 2 [Candidatus Moraniibacteriota bacterium]|nr:MAG: penicillin-binding protein 2 [Candidatus Moranbacteria bacterium]